MEGNKRFLILLASGSGTRFARKEPKQFVQVNGRMVLEYTLEACDCGLFDSCVLVLPEAYIQLVAPVLSDNRFRLPVTLVAGGSSRTESCRKGLAAIAEEDGIVVIHNAVQPFVSAITFERCLKAMETYEAALYLHGFGDRRGWNAAETSRSFPLL